MENITERKRVEERLREYEEAIEGSEEMIAVVDREYRYRSANRKYLKLQNMTKEQVIGRLMPEVVNKDVFEAVIKEKLDECFAGKIVKYEIRYTYPELGERDCSYRTFPLKLTPALIRSLVFCRTSRTGSGRKRHCARARINSDFFSTPPPKRFMESISNTAARSATLPAFAPWDTSELTNVLGKNMHELIHHTRADGTVFPVEECRIHRVSRTGEGVHADDEVLWRANGTSFPAEYWSYPRRRGPEVVGAVIAFVDITERKLDENALAQVSRKMIEAQEQERTRIARELHDDIGQRLALLVIETQELQEDPLICPKSKAV